MLDEWSQRAVRRPPSPGARQVLAFHVFDRWIISGLRERRPRNRGSENPTAAGRLHSGGVGEGGSYGVSPLQAGTRWPQSRAPYDLRSSNPDFETLSIQVQDEPIFVGTLVEHTRFSSAG